MMDLTDMQYVRGRITDFWEELLVLTQEHYNTVDTRPFPRPAPVKDMFEKLVSAGVNSTVWVLDDNRKVRGYSNSTIYPHLHYGGILVGMVDAFFVEKALRSKDITIGRRLLMETEESLRYRGAKIIQIASGVNYDIGIWLRRQGYSEFETHYIKEI